MNDSIGGTLKYFCLCGCLALAVGAKAFSPNQTLALGKWASKLCMVDIAGNQSTLICHPEPQFGKNLEGNGLPDSSQFLSQCPESWIKRKICIIIGVQKQMPMSPYERLKYLVLDPRNGFFNQVSHFLHNNLDELAENVISIGLPLVMTCKLYPAYVNWFRGLLLFETMNVLLSPIGVWVGEVIDYYQHGHLHPEKESKLSIHSAIREIIAQKVEDHVQLTGYVITYHPAIIIHYIENNYINTGEDMIDGSITSLSAQTGLFVIKKVFFAYDTLKMMECYSWLNEISKAISDIVTGALFDDGKLD